MTRQREGRGNITHTQVTVAQEDLKTRSEPGHREHLLQGNGLKSILNAFKEQ